MKTTRKCLSISAGCAVLFMAVMLWFSFSFPVKAATETKLQQTLSYTTTYVNQDKYPAATHWNKYNFIQEYDYIVTQNTVGIKSDVDARTYYIYEYSGGSFVQVKGIDGMQTVTKSGQYGNSITEPSTTTSVMTNSQPFFARGDYVSGGLNVINYVCTINVPVFESEGNALNYVLYGDTSGAINMPEVDIADPNSYDKAYYLKGFHADNVINASWTGVSERSNLKDVKVNEYLRLMVGYGYKNAPTQIATTKQFITSYPVSDNALSVDITSLTHTSDDVFTRYVAFIPYYSVNDGPFGSFYYGQLCYIYFNPDGTIEGVQKPDLSEGSEKRSLGYLQNVVYKESNNVLSERTATFTWSSLKDIPNARVEIVAENFYTKWFNNTTTEKYNFITYNHNVLYSSGKFECKSQDAARSWTLEKGFDMSATVMQTWGTKYYYLRLVVYNESTQLYEYGGWTRIDKRQGNSTQLPWTETETGGFDDNTGNWEFDDNSDDSYKYQTDSDGSVTVPIDTDNLDNINLNTFTWLFKNMQSMISAMGQFPTLIASVFTYLPNQLISFIGILLAALVILRFLGR